jgi:hypothetical protein
MNNEQISLQITMLIATIKHELMKYGKPTKGQLLLKASEYLRSGKVSADMLAGAFGDIEDLTVEDILKYSKEFNSISHVNL